MRRSIHTMAIVAALAGMAGAADYGIPVPVREPKPERDDAGRIASAQTKREKKAAKRARIAQKLAQQQK